MGHFTATTLGLLEAVCLLALVAGIACLGVAQTRRSRRLELAEQRRTSLREALRREHRGTLLVACEDARDRQDVREDVRAVAGALAPASQRMLLAEAARQAGLDDALRDSLASSDVIERGRALGLLGLLRLASCDELEPLLHDPDPEVRLVAVRAIASLDSGDGTRALLRALGSDAIEPDRVVEQLARASAVPELVHALSTSEHVAVRPLIAEALGLTRTLAGIAPLAALVRTGVEEERVRACRALGRIARPEVVPLLVEALADDAWAVRAEAARGLTGLGDQSCVPDLERALSDGAWWVRANAAEALRSLGPVGLEALVRASRSDDRVVAARAREALADEAALDELARDDLDLAA